MDADFSSLGLEKSPTTGFWSTRDYKSAATAAYLDQTGEEIIRLIALQYPSVEAMERDKGGGAPFSELENSLADLYCHPPICDWGFSFPEPWIFMVISFVKDDHAMKNDVMVALSKQ